MEELDRQTLYAQRLQLRQQLNSCLYDNSKLKTRMMILQRELLRLQKQKNISSKGGSNKFSTKLICSQLQEQVAQLASENKLLKRNVKLSNVKELTHEIEAQYQQLQRLRQVIVEQQQLAGQVEGMQRRIESSEQHIRQLKQSNRQLTTSNLSLNQKAKASEAKLVKLQTSYQQASKNYQRELNMLRRRLNAQMTNCRTFKEDLTKLRLEKDNAKSSNTLIADRRNFIASDSRKRSSQRKQRRLVFDGRSKGMPKTSPSDKKGIAREALGDAEMRLTEGQLGGVIRFRRPKNEQRNLELIDEENIVAQTSRPPPPSSPTLVSQIIGKSKVQNLRQKQRPLEESVAVPVESKSQPYDQDDFSDYQEQDVPQDQSLRRLGDLVAIRMLSCQYNSETVIDALSQQVKETISYSEVSSIVKQQPFLVDQSSGQALVNYLFKGQKILPFGRFKEQFLRLFPSYPIPKQGQQKKVCQQSVNVLRLSKVKLKLAGTMNKEELLGLLQKAGLSGQGKFYILSEVALRSQSLDRLQVDKGMRDLGVEVGDEESEHSVARVEQEYQFEFD